MRDSRTPWLIGPWMDGLFIIAAPLAILPLYHGLAILVPLAVLQVVVLGLSATGHHLPGFIRAYTDPVVFRRFRARLVIVPALIFALAAVAAWYKLSLLFFLLIVWGTWHGLMQVHGFLRIYDAKAGRFEAWRGRLDFWMCLTWFVQVILWSAGKKASILGTFYLAGGPLLSTEVAQAAETAWLALTTAVTALFVLVTIQDVRAGRHNARKLLSMAVSFSFWAYCMLTVDNIIVGLLLWELFHDLQYNAFVWSYNRGRVRSGLARSRFERFLFGGGRLRLVLYAVCIAAYGAIGFLGQDLIGVYQNQETYGTFWRQLGNVFACSALIHFYMDGFIWKLRDPAVRQDLGVETAAPHMAGPASAAAPAVAGIPGLRGAAARHWAFVAVFFAGAVALAASERFHWTRGQEAGRYASLAELVPNSAYAHFMRASELKAHGRLAEARAHYGKAIALDSAEYAFAHALAADLDVRLGDTAAAIAAYEHARRFDPRDPVVTGNLADLYQSRGLLPEAAAAFRALVALEPDNAEAHYRLATVLLGQRRGLDAKAHLERTLALDSAQPAALNYLGMVEHALGNSARARALYARALRIAPDYASARGNLARLDAEAPPER